MGSVWVADHLTLHTQVVVKFLSAAMASDPVLRERFSHEAAAASQVKSPHVVQMIDHGVAPNGLPFIAMEHLEGETLADHLRREKVLAPPVVATIVSQVCKALGRAHDRGIVHRDIKPDNLFLCEHQGEIFVKVLDFGIAKRPMEESGRTETGQAIGTPSFMSPEQLVGAKDVDRRSDLWSLGVVAFFLLTGAKPFAGGSIGGVALAIHTKEHPKPTERNPALPPAVDAWFARACALEAADRYQTARELADTLAEALGVSTTGPRSISVEAVSFSKLKLDPEPPQETGHGSLAQSIAPRNAIETLPAPPNRRSPLIVVGAIAVLVVVALVVFRSGSTPEKGAAAGSATQPALQQPSAAAPSVAPAPVVSATPPPAAPSASVSVTAAPAPTVTAKPGKPVAGTKPATAPATTGKASYDDIE